MRVLSKKPALLLLLLLLVACAPAPAATVPNAAATAMMATALKTALAEANAAANTASAATATPAPSATPQPPASPTPTGAVIAAVATNSSARNAGVEITPSPVFPATATPGTPGTPTPDERKLPKYWAEWPLVPTVSARAKEIFLLGQRMGNDPHSFTVIGDCQSEPNILMGVYDTDNYQLGAGYEYLDETVRQFKGSFARDSITVKDGMSVASVFAPGWADPNQCQPGETPLECEIRLHKPIIIFISLGTNWKGGDDVKHEEYMRRIVDYAISKGVLPVLSTKGDNQEGDHRINQSTARVAYDYDLPLWNFWLAIRDLPGKVECSGQLCAADAQRKVIGPRIAELRLSCRRKRHFDMRLEQEQRIVASIPLRQRLLQFVDRDCFVTEQHRNRLFVEGLRLVDQHVLKFVRLTVELQRPLTRLRRLVSLRQRRLLSRQTGAKAQHQQQQRGKLLGHREHSIERIQNVNEIARYREQDIRPPERMGVLPVPAPLRSRQLLKQRRDPISMDLRQTLHVFRRRNPASCSACVACLNSWTYRSRLP